MRFAVYHPWTYLRGGAERVLSELISRSEHEWTLFTHHHSPDDTFQELSGPHVVELAPRVEVRREFLPLLKGAITMARTRIDGDFDGLLVSSDGLGDLVALHSALPVTCFCHTPMKIVHDPVTAGELRRRDPIRALAARMLGPIFSAADERAWRRFRHVFANSEETKRRLCRAGLRAASAVEVLHPGVDLDRFGCTDGRRSARFLVAGRIMWQKRLDIAIDAFALARRSGLDAELIVAGTVDHKSRPYLAELRERAGKLPVRFEVDVDDERLAELYASSIATLFCAPNEDFGIVPLESMAAGTPVIAVNSGGATETVVDAVTGWLVEPSPESFARRMLEAALAQDRLEPMMEKARLRARKFGWEHFVTRVDEVMTQIAKFGECASGMSQDFEARPVAPIT